MANIKQQKKRIGTAQRQRMENLRYRSTIKTLFNRLQLAVDTGEKDIAASTHLELVRLLDRAVTRGSLHRNTSSRKKARASRMLLQEAKTDAATTRKKKKVAPARRPKADAAAKKDTAAKKPAAKKPATKAAKAEAPEAPVDEAPVDEAVDTGVDEAVDTNVDEAVDAPEAVAGDDAGDADATPEDDKG